MKIGKSCFVDKQIQAQIAGNKVCGLCSILDKEEEVYDTQKDDYLKDTFTELLDSFSPIDKNYELTVLPARNLFEYLKDWNIFAEKVDIQSILIAICPEYFDKNPFLLNTCVCINGLQSDEEYYKQSILTNGTWSDFCNCIKHFNRFHSNYINLERFRDLIDNSMSVEENEKKLILKRARICEEDTYNTGYKLEEVGAPPECKASAGRASSEGIPCLYLANSIETALYETRARDNDHVTIGTFKQVKKLRLVDFTSLDLFSPLSSENVEVNWFAANIDFVRQVANEVAKPLRRFDKALDYLPTQYICDFIKASGYDGIKYKSTLADNGINYAIFNSEKFKCIEVETILVKGVKFDWEYLKLV